MKKFLLGIILGFLLKIACVFCIDYKAVSRFETCMSVPKNDVFDCNYAFKLSPLEQILYFNGNGGCAAVRKTIDEPVFCKE
jgi:hypothetical protein